MVLTFIFEISSKSFFVFKINASVRNSTTLENQCCNIFLLACSERNLVRRFVRSKLQKRMPGYEVQFADPLDKSFECPVCWNALRSPVQVTPCGHRVCQSCLEPIMRQVSIQGYIVYKLTRPEEMSHFKFCKQ